MGRSTPVGAANPWPGADAGCGGLLYGFGIAEMRYRTVLIGVGRAIGICVQIIRLPVSGRFSANVVLLVDYAEHLPVERVRHAL